jgi:aspartyl-tRNA(Asn)/glutamyl-tRNA(Gln) amidotransferase subunit A
VNVMTDCSLLSISELAPQIASRRVSAEEVTECSLARISSENPRLNAFIIVLSDAARHAARKADEEIAGGRYRGPLHGVPISVKDLIDIKGVPTTAASAVRAAHVARADAPIVERLRAAGAVLIGKCNLHEFAFGSTSEDSAFGPVRHPADPARSPGGSSGGSAVAVATGMGSASIGTDTGGSIRIPSAACGIVGLKPTYGEISCQGIVPLSWSLDHVGPLARSVRDARLLYDAIRDGGSSSGIGREERRPPAELRLGVPRAYFLDLLDDEVRERFQEALDRLRQAGVRLATVGVPHAGDIATVYLHIQLAEASAYHASTLDADPDRYTPPVRLRLELGRYVMAEDYVRAQRGREVLRQEVDAALEGVDALALPSLPIPAPRLGETSRIVSGSPHPVRALMLRLTQLFNLTGHPAISIPCGRTAEGLPCGLQLVGRSGRTADLLQVALSAEPLISAPGDGSRAV